MQNHCCWIARHYNYTSDLWQLYTEHTAQKAHLTFVEVTFCGINFALSTVAVNDVASNYLAMFDACIPKVLNFRCFRGLAILHKNFSTNIIIGQIQPSQVDFSLYYGSWSVTIIFKGDGFRGWISEYKWSYHWLLFCTVHCSNENIFHELITHAKIVNFFRWEYIS